jgi:hypothetical protein
MRNSKQGNIHCYNGEDDEVTYDNGIEDTLVPSLFSNPEFPKEKGDGKPNDQNC